MSHRIERVNSVIRQEISELLKRHVKDPRLGCFITITEVDASADLRYAKVFVTHMGTPEEKQETLNALANAAGFLRKELANRLTLRRIPQLNFLWDDSIERGAHLLQLIDEITADDCPE